jgi:hypothetical protein
MSISPTTEKNVAFTGAGRSEAARPSVHSALALTVDACLRAVEDTGLTVDDIDGLATYPGLRANNNGYSPVGYYDIKGALRLKVDWFSEVAVGPSQLSAIFDTIGAINTGLCKNVLIFRTMNEASVRQVSRDA